MRFARAFAAVALPCVSIGVMAAPVSSSMMVEMTDITSVSRSPDGNTVVIGLCQDHAQRNQRELSWVIVQMQGTRAPKMISAGEEIYDPNAPGALLSPQAVWSRDGKWFFYLRRDGAEVQLWQTAVDGRGSRQLTRSQSDLVGLAQSSDTNELIVQLAPDRKMLAQAELDENRRGILYDDHVLGGFPLTELLPIIDRWRNVRRADDGRWIPPGWTKIGTEIFDIRRGELKPGGGAAPGPCSSNCSETRDYRATAAAVGKVSSENPLAYPGQFTLQIEGKGGDHLVTKCSNPKCTANQVTVLGWSPSGTEIYFIADSLAGRLGDTLPGLATVYAWNPSADSVRLIHGSDGRLYNLKSAAGLRLNHVPVTAGSIVLAAAGADQPPRVESIDLSNGTSRVIFDPNAELRSLTQRRAVWHSWPTSTEFPGRGIVILPRSYMPGHRYPAVITLYTCGSGFLRGGGGDNIPEFVASEAGFVAICVDITVREIMASKSGPGQLYPIMCDIVTSLIKDEDAAGLIDSSRVGLSGQSMGADLGAYCLSHTEAIAAAALRSGSLMERAQWDLFDTAAWRRDPVKGVYAVLHMPDPRHDPEDRWGQLSSAIRAPDIKTRVLIQASDTEYLGALPLWSAMHENSKAIEMYVFPKETHRLTEPIHELINDERQLDWFRYWLEDERDEASDKRGQYARWDELREISRNAVAH